MRILRMRRSYSYQTVEKKDPEETKHRRAQFLIYKTLEQADSAHRRTRLGLRMCRLRVKVGRRLSKLRSSLQVTFSGAGACLCKQLVGRIKLWRPDLYAKEVALPLVF